MSDSMAGPAALPDAATVLAFWREAGPARWYAPRTSNSTVRSPCVSKPRTWRRRAGELMAWSASAEGVLALLILLDQFPRNAYRGTGHMFATDGLARQICERAIAAGLDRQGPERFAAVLLHAARTCRRFGGPGTVCKPDGAAALRKPCVGRKSTAILLLAGRSRIEILS